MATIDRWYSVNDCCGKPPMLEREFYDCGICPKYRFRCRVCGRTTDWKRDIHGAVDEWEAMFPSRAEREEAKLIKTLKPCPFCGKEVIPLMQSENGIARYEGLAGEEIAYFHCGECDMDFYIDTPFGDKGKIEQWNTRAEAKT